MGSKPSREGRTSQLHEALPQRASSTSSFQDIGVRRSSTSSQASFQQVDPFRESSSQESEGEDYFAPKRSGSSSFHEAALKASARTSKSSRASTGSVDIFAPPTHADMGYASWAFKEQLRSANKTHNVEKKALKKELKEVSTCHRCKRCVIAPAVAPALNCRASGLVIRPSLTAPALSWLWDAGPKTTD